MLCRSYEGSKVRGGPSWFKKLMLVLFNYHLILLIKNKFLDIIDKRRKNFLVKYRYD